MISRWSLALVTFMLAAAMAPAGAQPAPESSYAVSYIEVDGKSALAARKLLRAQRDRARKAAGFVAYDVLERMWFPHHFAIDEQWEGAKAREDLAAQPASKELRAALAPMLISPYDERAHYALSVRAGRKPV